MHYLQLCTNTVELIAVRIVMTICTICFQVPLLILFTFHFSLFTYHLLCESVAAIAAAVVAAGTTTCIIARTPGVRTPAIRATSVSRCTAGAGDGFAVCLFEGDVLHQRLRIDILLDDFAVRLDSRSYHDALNLRLEQYAARGDGRCRAVVCIGHTD